MVLGGQAFALAEPEGAGLVVEDQQVVLGVAGQPDHVADRQHAAPAGERDAGFGVQVLEAGGDDDADRQAVVAAQ
ncbi:MAG: hypothetical protein JWR32_2626, partial [Mycobacterium sp.]|nr:hypothetical protein [Mycobacterium sp.]